MRLVLIQILIHLLQRQESDGSWNGFKEATAYALLMIHTFKNTAERELLGSRIGAAVIKGRCFLAENYDITEPDPLWIEKVQYGSRIISEAYMIAALYCSSDYTIMQSPPIISAIWEKASAMGRVYEKLSLLKDAPNWLILACSTEGSCFTPSLRRKYQNILQDLLADGKHLCFIPFTWVMVTRLIGVELAPNVQLDKMTFSALLYALDHHMETSIAARSVEERQAIRDTVASVLINVEAAGHIPINIPMDKVLEQIVVYVWEHSKVQRASTPDKQQLLIDICQLYLSHLDQLDDNEDLRKTRRVGSAGSPINIVVIHHFRSGFSQSRATTPAGVWLFPFSFVLSYLALGPCPGPRAAPLSRHKPDIFSRNCQKAYGLYPGFKTTGTLLNEINSGET